MSDYPGHPRDGNYNDPGYQRALGHFAIFMLLFFGTLFVGACSGWFR